MEIYPHVVESYDSIIPQVFVLLCVIFKNLTEFM